MRKLGKFGEDKMYKKDSMKIGFWWKVGFALAGLISIATSVVVIWAIIKIVSALT